MRKNIGKNYLYVLKKLIVKQTKWTARPSLSREVSKHSTKTFKHRWIDPTNNLSFQVIK